MPTASIIQIIVMILFPILVMETVKRNKIAGMIGPVILCYAVGLIIGNLPNSPVDVDLSQSMSEAVVPLAISLMLLSTRFIAWLKYAKKTALSFGLAVVAVMVASFTVSFLFQHFGSPLPDIWKLSGMMVGVYTGGTPNLAAIGTGLGVSNETFIILNACDLVLSATYLLLLMTVAQKLALKFLPSFVKVETNDRDETFHYKRLQEMASNTKIGLSLVSAFFIAAVIMGLSLGFSFLVSGKLTAPNVILAVTTLSIAASFIKKVRFLPRTYEFGEYFLLIFCLGIGDMHQFIGY